MASGRLRTRLAFDKRADVDDGAGAVEGGFVEQFQIAAELTPKFGGETVQQARLQGRATFTVVVRASRQSRAVATDWQARDARTGTVYAILSGPIDTETRNRYLEFLMQTGTAS
jgi:head-tail adaptor